MSGCLVHVDDLPVGLNMLEQFPQENILLVGLLVRGPQHSVELEAGLSPDHLPFPVEVEESRPRDLDPFL